MKVGVFDSGIGGLTVLSALQKHIKGASLFYIADTQNAPYGEKSSEQILQFSLDITQHFIDNHQIDALIVACNTATSAAIHTLRERYPELIIIGMEPGIKPAIEQTKTGNVGVLATPATLKGEKYQQLVSMLSTDKEVSLFEQACPGLVEQIEKGEANSSKTRGMLEEWLHPMRENNVDSIVLGCTHYPLVADVILDLMHTEVTLIHTGNAIAKHLLDRGSKIGHDNTGELFVSIYSTGKIELDLINEMIDVSNGVKHERITIS